MPSLVRNTGVGGSTADVTGLNCTTALTVAIWMRFKFNGTSATDIIRHASTANNARDGFRVGFSNTEFRLDILGATGSSNYPALTGARWRDGLWHHYVATYDAATNNLRGYIDGKLNLVNTTVAQDFGTNASTTTTWNPSVIGNGAGYLFFDFQILPDVVVPPQDVPLLMDPRVKYPGVKGRYFGLNFRTTAAGTNACRDESDNGNNLTISPSAFHQGEEPPWRAVVGF